MFHVSPVQTPRPAHTAVFPLVVAAVSAEFQPATLHNVTSGFSSGSQVPYHLHAVLVHEGQANAGHYWAYIYNQPRQVWLKYNDISVTESSWEELERDSYGGLRNVSAYCLMYINDKLPHVNAGKSIFTEPGAWGNVNCPGRVAVSYCF